MTSGMTVDGDFEDVAKAVVERLRPVAELSDWELFWWPTTSFSLPALLVRPDPAKDRDYQGTLFGYTKWMIRLELHVDAVDDEAAYREMGRLVSKRGPIIARLRDDEVRDVLYDLCGLNIALTDGRGWKMNRRKRLQADIGLALGAN